MSDPGGVLVSPQRLVNTTRRLVTVYFIVLVALIGAGLQWVKDDANSNAQNVAQKLATEQGNQTTCVTQVILARIKASSDQASSDKTQSPSARERAKASADYWRLLLVHLTPVPPNLNCYTLLDIPEPGAGPNK